MPSGHQLRAESSGLFFWMKGHNQAVPPLLPPKVQAAAGRGRQLGAGRRGVHGAGGWGGVLLHACGGRAGGATHPSPHQLTHPSPHQFQIKPTSSTRRSHRQCSHRAPAPMCGCTRRDCSAGWLRATHDMHIVLCSQPGADARWPRGAGGLGVGDQREGPARARAPVHLMSLSHASGHIYNAWVGTGHEICSVRSPSPHGEGTDAGWWAGGSWTPRSG